MLSSVENVNMSVITRYPLPFSTANTGRCPLNQHRFVSPVLHRVSTHAYPAPRSLQMPPVRLHVGVRRPVSLPESRPDLVQVRSTLTALNNALGYVSPLAPHFPFIFLALLTLTGAMLTLRGVVWGGTCMRVNLPPLTSSPQGAGGVVV